MFCTNVLNKCFEQMFQTECFEQNVQNKCFARNVLKIHIKHNVLTFEKYLKHNVSNIRFQTDVWTVTGKFWKIFWTKCFETNVRKYSNKCYKEMFQTNVFNKCF